MIYLTQLIYLKPGQEEVFDQFEAVAIPLISKYNGRLLFRIRPSEESVIEGNLDEMPYEVHFVEFNSDTDFTAFMQDESRKHFLHLKEQSIRAGMLVKGEKL